MEETIILQQKISKYLNEFYDSIELQNAAGDYTINKAAENIFRNLLNRLYDYDLVNTNLEISNYPAIDLMSTKAKVCYQVTYTDSVEKIKDTLDKFFKNGLNKQFDTISFLILKSARNYSKEAFYSNYIEILAKNNIQDFDFDLKKNIVDNSCIYKLILNLTNSSQLIEIKEMLEEYSTGKKTRSNLSEYYEGLKNEFYEVVMEDPSGMTLSDIYIDPMFQYYKPLILDDIYDKNNHESFVDLKDIPKDVIASFLSSETAVLDRIFKKPQSAVLFVLGYPGQGKTSFCKKIIYEHLKEQPDIDIFYLKLRNVRNTRALIDNPLKVIHEELEIEVDQELQKKILKKSIIILDGLDELYMKDNLKSEDIERFSKELIRDCERLKYHKVIVTTRYGYIDLKRIYENQFLAISLKPLTLKQQLDWFSKYEVFHPRTILTEEKIKNFNHEDSTIGYIKELINQPLLLYIIASLNVELDNQTDRAQIYDLLFDQIIDRRYSKDGQIDALKNLTKDDLRNLLREIAYLIFTSGNEYVTEEQLLSDYVVKEYIRKIGGNSLSGTLKGVLISFYFKESKRKEANDKLNTGIEFLHKSLQEFLAAEKIVESCFNEALNKDMKGRYFLKQESDLLIWLNDIFGKQALSREIISFISIMIPKRNEEIRKELSNRLQESLEYFLEKDFIYQYVAIDKGAFEKILILFQSYWLLCALLDQRRNYLTTGIITEKVVSYMNAISSTFVYSHGINISYQTFTNCRVNFLSSVADDEVRNVIFDESHISYSNTIMFRKAINCVFINCQCFRLSFFETQIVDCKFENCELNNAEFFNTVFTNVIFKNCNINRLEIYVHQTHKSKNLIFTNVTFDDQSYEALKKLYPLAKFKQCRIQVKDQTYIEIE